jgi:hypothetical protein
VTCDTDVACVVMGQLEPAAEADDGKSWKSGKSKLELA